MVVVAVMLVIVMPPPTTNAPDNPPHPPLQIITHRLTQPPHEPALGLSEFWLVTFAPLFSVIIIIGVFTSFVHLRIG